MRNFKKVLTSIHDTYLSFRFLVWYMFLHTYVIDFHMLEGESMYPTFEPYGDIVLVDKVTPRLFSRNFKKDDIVCVVNPVNNEINLCKRITHLAGETVKFRNSNNEIEVPKNHVWLEGDNKDNSLDSRNFGPIPQRLILGKVWLQLWPTLKLI